MNTRPKALESVPYKVFEVKLTGTGPIGKWSYNTVLPATNEADARAIVIDYMLAWPTRYTSFEIVSITEIESIKL